MDEQRRLVIELHTKLAELDQRVGNYRRDMVAEFEKYTENLLHDTPKDISIAVSEMISLSKKNYQSLYPPFLEACESGSAPAGINQEPPPSSPSTAHETSSPTFRQYSFPSPKSHFRASADWKDDTDIARSPHEREREFQGVFTPSYLPLLGDTRQDRRTSHDSNNTRSPSPRSVSEPSHVDASTDTPHSLTTTPDLQKPLPPRRRDTEDSTVSDTSEGTVRRSALRTSSNSSMKPSPRRVRFDFEGVEVLPTSSPLPPSTMLSEGSLSEPSADDEPESEQVEDISYFQEEEELPPPPKRVTSSQRLLALSRSSREDDGTTWTTVNGPSDDSSSIEKGADSHDSLTDLSHTSQNRPSLNLTNRSVGDNRSPNSPALSSEAAARANAARSEEDTDSDDDALDMPSLSSMKGRKSLPEPAILSPASPQQYEPLNSPSATPQIADRRWKDIETLGGDGKIDVDHQDFTMDDLDDEVFNFEERGYNGSSLEEPEDEDDEDDDSPSTKSPASPTGGAPVLSQYGQSPGRPIMRQALQPQQPQSAGSLGVIGSYRGHPFSMPVVNEDIHAKIAAMDDVKSFVGGVDGKSGFDDGDMASYRASYSGASFTGAPRSLTERMMMDELRETGRSGQHTK